MKKFNPVEYAKSKWSDPKHTKNRPCSKDHTYCHLQYQWGATLDKPQPLVTSLPNVQLPSPQNEGVAISYDGITEENLDDWMSQSMNRTIKSMLNPQKKFFLPTPFQEELRVRHRSKVIAKEFEDATYFDEGKAKAKRTVSYMSNRRKTKLNPAELCFNYRQLMPSMDSGGTPIKVRESKDKPKTEIRRRNAVLLEKDIHYSRFLKQLAKTRVKPQQQEGRQQAPPPKKEMLYSFNIDSLRRKSCSEDVPNSLIEKEFKRVREIQKEFVNVQRNHLIKQEEIHQKNRVHINDKTVEAIAKIQNIAKEIDLPKSLISYTLGQAVAPPPKRAVVKVVQPAVRLQEKVMRLMNSMQVISEEIDVEMSRLNIHLEEVPLKNTSEKIQVKWVLKAQQKIRENQNVLAIDCYKQAIILQPDFFIPVFNIAVLLEKEQMLSYAQMWFQLAKEFETDQESVSFGLALVQIKQLKFEEGLNEIDELITKLEGARKKVDLTYYYLRALCYKQLQKHTKARADYQNIMRNSKPSNYSHLSNCLLTVVYSKSRRLSIHFNCLSYMRWQQSLFLLFYERPRRMKEEGMSPNELVDRLSTCRFFSRFSRNLLLKLLAEVQYEYIKKDSIIFIRKQISTIILNGLVAVKCHEQDIRKPQTVSVLQQGSVIGAGKIDGDLSSQPNNWFLAATDVEIFTINRQDFALFWQGQITFQFDFKYNFLRNVSLFRNLSQATLFKLCELVERREYDKNTILFNDCSFRVQTINKEGSGFGMAKLARSDYRFVNAKKSNRIEELGTHFRKRHISRLCQILKKQIFKFNDMKFNRLKYPGLFILAQGRVEVEDDRGFRCKDILSERDYFGENLLIESDGFQNYGRMVVDSFTASFLLLPIDKMVWAFTLADKQIMTTNAKSRKEIETIRFLRNRFNECLEVKFAHRALQNG